MPIRINDGQPEWKDVGADTWNPFSSSNIIGLFFNSRLNYGDYGWNPIINTGEGEYYNTSFDSATNTTKYTFLKKCRVRFMLFGMRNNSNQVDYYVYVNDELKYHMYIPNNGTDIYTSSFDMNIGDSISEVNHIMASTYSMGMMAMIV